ncbi:hypothetical protein [Brochothrix thermosphacta]|uniref:hypothetical protein n=1 Tax=Brochothrix thermosphacta TaxID=2756 RepID=UPI00083FBE73|nr:hypothetical protein [Brochothrix thermosphacta]ODJ65730.1 hypothetical protein BFR37_10225 [Brochothrix thermosphacta]
MIDMLSVIYEKLKTNEVIKAQCGSRIFYYELPETAATDKPFMIIIPLDVPVPVNYGGNTNHSEEYLYQIDVQSHDRKVVKIVQNEIRKELENINLYQQTNGFDEYFNGTKRYVDARRYIGIPLRYQLDTQ